MNILNKLHTFWNNLLKPYSNDFELINSEFKIITENYTSTSRFYHDINHILLMLNLLEKFKTEIKNFDSISFAIWFHDVVYIPSSPENEEKSAEYASAFLQKINYKDTKRVFELILLTKTHILENTVDADAAYFLDFDLAVLSANESEYVAYVQKIRQEYSDFDDSMFYEARAKFLAKILERKYIYNSPHFQQLNESSARKNITNELFFIYKII